MCQVAGLFRIAALLLLVTLVVDVRRASAILAFDVDHSFSNFVGGDNAGGPISVTGTVTVSGAGTITPANDSLLLTYDISFESPNFSAVTLSYDASGTGPSGTQNSDLQVFGAATITANANGFVFHVPDSGSGENNFVSLFDANTSPDLPGWHQFVLQSSDGSFEVFRVAHDTDQTSVPTAEVPFVNDFTFGTLATIPEPSGFLMLSALTVCACGVRSGRRRRRS